jgi:2-methylcitrate dehydratase PrpD
MDSERPASDLMGAIADLGARWEILDTGISVKLYPSCAATHPPLDALLQLVRSHGFTDQDVDAIDVEVDSMTPRLLIHERPATELEAKFSMPFCAAAAVAYGRVGIDTFEAERLRDPQVAALMSRVAMRVDLSLGGIAPPLTQARVTIRLRDGRSVGQAANGARGYPERPASDAELGAKFMGCARRTISEASAERVLAMLREIDKIDDMRSLTEMLQPRRAREARGRASTP